MKTTAIIGGSGLTKMGSLKIIEQTHQQTPYGLPSSACTIGELCGQTIIFLARHGDPHTIAPHKVNYRANLWALKQAGAEQIIAVAAVGGITPEMQPARIAIPEQIIDYSYDREHTYFAAELEPVNHIDFSYPYDENLRQQLINSATALQLNIQPNGVYGCTQGPRLETAAEITRLQRDGCDLVGMTGMPEAALARELEIPYACIAVVANWAAGKSSGEISMPEIIKNLEQGMTDTEQLLQQFFIHASIQGSTDD
ncbi:5'-methylthioinosine phosphorylase [Bathymodiolus japonicus methanotrophic gill symbiont]|uniref:S-methyl-5'-thioinosine phosphorylase n=1 Tax=Bathymodiolus japonicus methanotrophic gill symbiont TaxID=113269 RepID=UPI001B73E5E1|nr:S-methyl-5'-thioinosine phosphorylase [Bathymodiolus japonicus methanotrophic gill symbiont]GFO71432.1 5'-methylthioinosine phosphorylase [Bathymodiolus japonicus methanotrophic gill symbiont]